MLSNGVYVMTSTSAKQLGAATVTWLSQASFVPPLLMVALRRQSDVFQHLAESGAAAIHIVGEHQQDIAWRFLFPPAAERASDEARPCGGAPAPLLDVLPAHLECGLERIVDVGGDHVVVILRVVDARCQPGVRPLMMSRPPAEYEPGSGR